MPLGEEKKDCFLDNISNFFYGFGFFFFSFFFTSRVNFDTFL